MVKKSGRMSSTSLRSGAAMPMLMMECWDESLSPVQIAAYKEKVLECQRSQEKVREAHRLAQLGKAIVTVLDDPRKRVPPPTLQQLSPEVIQGAQAPRSTPQEPPRSTSPDIIFIGESPPVQKTPPAPPAQVAQARAPLSHFPAVPRQLVQTVQMPGIQLQRFPSHQPQTTALQIQGGSIIIPQRANIQQTLQQLTPVDGTYGIGVKRALPQQLEDTSPKRKRVETDNQGNWVPLDEFYYGKMEGDPTYSEEKNEFRFKCWYCNKMLYNNIKAMMHIQGHIDSSKQQNIDLSDLTQCKHCYRQFDTPFEMQTHVEKVHMNNVNVLMCRICERDHQSRQALMTHMRVNHNACEMPYICQLCKFRSSMYSDVVDHFKKKHDSSQHILCLYCLKVFAVKFVSQGWGQTQTYYGHLLKHQSKSNSKKCTFCRLTFVNPADCKTHKKKDHAANQKGIDSRPSVYGQDMMIKVPESGLSSKQALKSLNAPAVSKVLDFGGTRFPYAVNYNSCVECKTVMGTPDHFRKHIECSMCRFATSCSIAYANHMMGFHSGQMSSLNLNIPWERPMKEPMHCLCGFVSRYGNKIANHLVYCTKRSCYSTKPAPVVRETEAQEDVDPRYKPGASLLDALGLVKKKNVSTNPNEDEMKSVITFENNTERMVPELLDNGERINETNKEVTNEAITNEEPETTTKEKSDNEAKAIGEFESEATTNKESESEAATKEKSKSEAEIDKDYEKEVTANTRFDSEATTNKKTESEAEIDKDSEKEAAANEESESEAEIDKDPEKEAVVNEKSESEVARKLMKHSELTFTVTESYQREETDENNADNSSITMPDELKQNVQTDLKAEKDFAPEQLHSSDHPAETVALDLSHVSMIQPSKEDLNDEVDDDECDDDDSRSMTQTDSRDIDDEVPEDVLVDNYSVNMAHPGNEDIVEEVTEDIGSHINDGISMTKSSIEDLGVEVNGDVDDNVSVSMKETGSKYIGDEITEDDDDYDSASIKHPDIKDIGDAVNEHGVDDSFRVCMPNSGSEDLNGEAKEDIGSHNNESNSMTKSSIEDLDVEGNGDVDNNEGFSMKQTGSKDIGDEVTDGAGNEDNTVNMTHPGSEDIGANVNEDVDDDDESVSMIPPGSKDVVEEITKDVGSHNNDSVSMSESSIEDLEGDVDNKESVSMKQTGTEDVVDEVTEDVDDDCFRVSMSQLCSEDLNAEVNGDVNDDNDSMIQPDSKVTDDKVFDVVDDDYSVRRQPGRENIGDEDAGEDGDRVLSITQQCSKDLKDELNKVVVDGDDSVSLIQPRMEHINDELNEDVCDDKESVSMTQPANEVLNAAVYKDVDSDNSGNMIKPGSEDPNDDEVTDYVADDDYNVIIQPGSKDVDHEVTKDVYIDIDSVSMTRPGNEDWEDDVGDDTSDDDNEEEDDIPSEEKRLSSHEEVEEVDTEDVRLVITDRDEKEMMSGKGLPYGEFIIRAEDNPNIYTRKLARNMDQSNSQQSIEKLNCVRKKKHCCFICQKMSFHLPSHFSLHHSSDPAVVGALSCNVTNRKKIYDRLRARGDHLHNTMVMKEGKGELILSCRKGRFNSKDFGPCPKCLVWLHTRNLKKHQRKFHNCSLGDSKWGCRSTFVNHTQGTVLIYTLSKPRTQDKPGSSAEEPSHRKLFHENENEKLPKEENPLLLQSSKSDVGTTFPDKLASALTKSFDRQEQNEHNTGNFCSGIPDVEQNYQTEHPVVAEKESPVRQPGEGKLSVSDVSVANPGSEALEQDLSDDVSDDEEEEEDIVPSLGNARKELDNLYGSSFPHRSHQLVEEEKNEIDNMDESDDVGVRRDEEAMSEDDFSSEEAIVRVTDNTKPFIRRVLKTENSIVIAEDNPKIYIKKALKSVDISNSGQPTEKLERAYHQKHCCFFCQKMTLHIRDHLVRRHGSDPTVQEALSVNRFDRFKHIRAKGDHLHNMKVMKEGKGELILSRRTGSFISEDFKPCPECLEWMHWRSINRHYRRFHKHCEKISQLESNTTLDGKKQHAVSVSTSSECILQDKSVTSTKTYHREETHVDNGDNSSRRIPDVAMDQGSNTEQKAVAEKESSEKQLNERNFSELSTATTDLNLSHLSTTQQSSAGPEEDVNDDVRDDDNSKEEEDEVLSKSRKKLDNLYGSSIPIQSHELVVEVKTEVDDMGVSVEEREKMSKDDFDDGGDRGDEEAMSEVDSSLEEVIVRVAENTKIYLNDPRTEDTIVRAEDNPKIYIKKVLKNTDISDQPTKKQDCEDNQRHCCFLCQKMTHHLPDHLARCHRSDPAVQEALMSDQKGRFDQIQAKGDHLHNMKVVKEGKGELILLQTRERFISKDYQPCFNCLKWMHKRYFETHFRNVHKKPKEIDRGRAGMMNVYHHTPVASYREPVAAEPTQAQHNSDNVSAQVNLIYSHNKGTQKEARRLDKQKWSIEEKEELKLYFGDFLVKRTCPTRLQCLDILQRSRVMGGVLHRINWQCIITKISHENRRNCKSTSTGNFQLKRKANKAKSRAKNMKTSWEKAMSKSIQTSHKVLARKKSKSGLKHKSGKRISDLSAMFKRKRWTEEEERELNFYFGSYLASKTCPSKRECMKVIAKSAERGGVIHKRYWQNIIKKISAVNNKNRKLVGVSTENKNPEETKLPKTETSVEEHDKKPSETETSIEEHDKKPAEPETSIEECDKKAAETLENRQKDATSSVTLPLKSASNQEKEDSERFSHIVEHKIWSKEELDELQLYLGDFLATKTCPSKKRCLEAIEWSREKGGVLQNRYYHNIIKKISFENNKKRKSEEKHIGNFDSDKTVRTKSVSSKVPNKKSNKSSSSKTSTSGKSEASKNIHERKRWSEEDEEEIRKYFGEFLSAGTCPSKKHCLKAIEKSKQSGGTLHTRYWHNIVKKVSNLNIKRSKFSKPN
ncbi:uncharacterized protein LOC134245743 isoform X2 [Saccostrea cucullata]|uniref:uncharacterized protein LOC134245743 isoform X2 n=1 Tax=Saccostrea cuccullata TaxID=36930 RepID=UPI002ED5299E